MRRSLQESIREPSRVDVPALLRSLYIDATRNHRGEWWAICPTGSHRDRTPSWSIRDQIGSDKHGLHHCFACQWEGGPIELVREVIGLSYGGAVEYVNDLSKHAIPVVSVEWQVSSPVRSSFKLPAGVVQAPIDQWVTPPRRYLERRGVTAQAELFRLGYAVTGRCDGRVVIPVYNAQNRLVSYTGRSYVEHPKRYLEPTEDEQADKSSIFGEHLWNDPERLRGVVAITEGAFNGLAVREVFPTLPIAGLQGSDVTPMHVLKLSSSFRAGLVLTDPDFAGDRAAEKLMGALSRHMDLVRITTPSGMDWNDLLLRDRGEMQCRLRDGLRKTEIIE